MLMTTFFNTKLRSRVTPDASGDLCLDRQITDLDAAGFLTSAPASGDNIQIGVVPAGCKLVPHLCLLQVPALDTNAASTVKYKIGSVATAAALAAEVTPGNNATSVVPAASFIVTAAGFGSPTDDTPVYLNLSAAVATQPAAGARGKVLFDLALRAWDSVLDS
jgi:hypothetical protein